jgi:uncharacterized membrane protein
MAICFFAFTFGLRNMAYTLALLGGLEDAPANSPQAEVMVAQTAIVLTVAVKGMNTGIRGFYFAVAGLFLFLGPYISILATLMMSFMLYYRQGLSREATAIERYVKALRQIEK